MRPRHPMPDFVHKALEEHGLIEAYEARPPYQRNDYVGWIARAKREETRLRRLTQMLDELRRGDVYMKMAWSEGWKVRSSTAIDERGPAGEPRRILIIGNSGSGKSTLAATLSAEDDLAHLDLDLHAWQSTSPPTRTPIDVAEAAIRAFTSKHDGWVIEGCYADLGALVCGEANELVFLDLPVDRCQQHARRRAWEPHKFPTAQAQQENLRMLLQWIAEYPERDGPLGRRAHVSLFESFRGKREHRTS